MNRTKLNLIAENAEKEKRCIYATDVNQHQSLIRQVKAGTFVRTFRNLYARKDYWEKLYLHEKIRHIAIPLMERHSNWKFTASTAAALIGYQVVENYDDPDYVHKKGNVSYPATQIYISCGSYKSNTDNPCLNRIHATGNEQDGTSDNVRIVTYADNANRNNGAIRAMSAMSAIGKTSGGNGRHAGKLIKLPHFSDNISDDIKSHIVDKSTMLFDTSITKPFRSALAIFDSAAKDNVNFAKVIEICRRRCENAKACKSSNHITDFSYDIEDFGETYNEYDESSGKCYGTNYSGQLGYMQNRVTANSQLSFENVFGSNIQDNLTQLRKLCYFANGLSENGGESFARGTMITLGFMVPKLQHEFVLQSYGIKYRSDFLWKLPNNDLIIGELDGYSKYYIDEFDNNHANIDLNSSSNNQMLRNSYNRSVINHNIDKQAEREALLMKECGVSKIVRFNFSEVIDYKKLEKKLTAAGVPRIMRM